VTTRCNLALLSTAHIHTRDFLKNIAEATDGRKAAAIWDDVPDRGRRYAESCGARFEPDLDALIGAADLDGFLICAENVRHLPLLEKVLPAGKPVMCEKPLVTSLEDLKRVRELHTKYPAPLFCGYFLPFTGEMLAIARLLDEGKLGAVTRIRCRSAHFGAYGRWFDNPDLAWFADPELAAGGGFMDMGAHAIHLVRSLFGAVENVQAVLQNQSGNYPAVDDGGVAILRMASGAVCTIEAGWTQSGGVLRELEITGSERTLWHDGKTYVSNVRKEAPEPVVPLPAAPDRMDRLAAIIRGEIPAEILRRDLEAVFDSVEIMSACYASSRTATHLGPACL